jgi:uncharacterized protein YbjT (DUF2867 family)
MSSTGDNTKQAPYTLVVGGTGKTGRRVADRLAARGVPTRIGSRSGRPAFDWLNQATWAPALQNVAAAYVTYYPDLALPGSAAAIGAFSDVAVTCGVRRLVLLSGRGEEEAQRCEQIVQASGAEWTIVRASWFAQNFSESFLLDMVLAGEIALPAGNVAEPFVDADDVADVAVAALTEAGHAGQLYEVTGPRMLTFAEAAAEIARATNKNIRYLPLSHAEFAAALAEQQVPEDMAGLLTYLFTTVLDGRNAYLADGVERALGRKARDFSDYVRNAAATGAWGR